MSVREYIAHDWPALLAAILVVLIFIGMTVALATDIIEEPETQSED